MKHIAAALFDAVVEAIRGRPLVEETRPRRSELGNYSPKQLDELRDGLGHRPDQDHAGNGG